MTSDKTPLSLDDASALLDLLCNDDAFRGRFQADPGSALAEISEAAGKSGDCCETAGALASKEEFAASRERLMEFLAANSSFFFPHCFVAGQVNSTMDPPQS